MYFLNEHDMTLS